ncbi:MAG: endonuclease/exonuclease/phosphatase family protein [Bauldia sp.]|nr:endonuclease/exonuclease/phosphatase family protein [Bauldia sp.]
MTSGMLKPAQPAPLTAPTEAERDDLRAAAKTGAVHRALIAGLACMNRVETSVGPVSGGLRFPLTVAAWNLERGLSPEASADLLLAERADLVLLSEIDNGMARTAQRHVARDIADRLDMDYAYGVEFLELGLGSAVEKELAGDASNDNGFHGNALMTAAPMIAPAMIRLDDHGHWFNEETGQPRVGGRCAIVATIPLDVGAIVAVSVHLENRADGNYRAAQMETLLDCLAGYAGDLPIVIGGDLNTAVETDDDFDREPLFAIAAEAGFERHGGLSGEVTTRVSRLSRNPAPPCRLDWFLTRGLAVTESRVVAALGPDGTPLSDHELIVAEIGGFTADTIPERHRIPMPEAY